MSTVSVIIPAYNEERHIGFCLKSLWPLRLRGDLVEVIVVNDGSTDQTAEIAKSFGVKLLNSPNLGAGGARNIGANNALGELLWFVDADCVVQEDSLDYLLFHLKNKKNIGVGGSYRNQLPGKYLPSLIHDEIEHKHSLMNGDVDFLASFSVLYRKDAFLASGGFNSEFKKAQDVELSFRLAGSGAHLKFEPKSKVYHFHEENILKYLKVQYMQGFYRIKLYREYPAKLKGDSYSSLADMFQPVFSLLILFSILGFLFESFFMLFWVGLLCLAFSGGVVSYSVYRNFKALKFYYFIPFYLVRALVRTVGMLSYSAGRVIR
ncbi:glycosyltransferase [uncultured Microbulbifer sp.]|uniref:glycosyltransferase n=1 Tax=uncultured Microbulbifer sp. TaxID=348147 RepID=UPI00261A4BF0|nr:glycosyltransferase [uncultured Microbulbifer sp.]